MFHDECGLEGFPVFYQRGLTREKGSLLKPSFYPCSFSPAMPTARGCTQLPLTRYRLYCILKNGRGNERQLHCLRFLRSSRQVDHRIRSIQNDQQAIRDSSVIFVAPYWSYRISCLKVQLAPLAQGADSEK